MIEQVIKRSCYDCIKTDGENLLRQFVFGYQQAGSLQVYDGKKTISFGEGSFWLAVKNRVARFTKTPPANGEFKSVSITFNDETLRQFSKNQDKVSATKIDAPPIIILKEDNLYNHFFKSLEAFDGFTYTDTKPAVERKLIEALVVLLKVQPELKEILFDFEEPHKIGLAAFMEENYKFNLPMSQFAYLTGRSLSSFKRDFRKIYQNTPAKWLQKKRLEAAYFLIKEKNRSPSEVYIELGFEDLSHFSYVFKKQFSVNPSALAKHFLIE
ncbi:AraC family transcriptional regulator [Dyadobacter sp. NIV53]|uniref:helix-turn-helix domain-containing protein n=1 Tax=Dyadobacter sp. NIV53 TaxID=2861765 RepID=UPI001C88196F|nr:AraC family transcriptional regulator [Dyadobacter sp. NIV53]